jgi:VanZ family protein
MKNLNERQTFWVRWGPALLLMAMIFLFSSIPSKEMPNFGSFDLSFKKGGHMIGYALLAVSYLHGLGSNQPKARIAAWLMALLYAITDEIHQSFVPGRGPWVVDVGIDSIGALIGLLVISRWSFLPTARKEAPERLHGA